MLFNNNSPFFGVNRNPLVTSLFVQYFSDNSSIPPPPVQNYWVEDLSLDQMVTEDLSQQYVFIEV